MNGTEETTTERNLKERYVRIIVRQVAKELENGYKGCELCESGTCEDMCEEEDGGWETRYHDPRNLQDEPVYLSDVDGIYMGVRLLAHGPTVHNGLVLRDIPNVTIDTHSMHVIGTYYGYQFSYPFSDQFQIHEHYNCLVREILGGY